MARRRKKVTKTSDAARSAEYPLERFRQQAALASLMGCAVMVGQLACRHRAIPEDHLYPLAEDLDWLADQIAASVDPLLSLCGMTVDELHGVLASGVRFD